MVKQRYTELAPDLVLVMSHGGSPTAEEWSHDMKHARALEVKKLRRLIVSLDGSAATTAQRKELDQILADKGIESLTAVMTASAPVRALFTVVRWMGVNKVRVFGLNDLSQATSFLSMTGDEVLAARKVIGQHTSAAQAQQQAS